MHTPMIRRFTEKRIGVICGGFSTERSVSLRSGKNVYASLCRLGYDAVIIDPLIDILTPSCMDIAFNMLHGFYGEDGGIQALLESLKIPYTGSGVAASQLSINKALTKSLMSQHNLPTPNFSYIYPDNRECLDKLSFPLIAKPMSEGSSVGVVIFDSKDAYQQGIDALLEKYSCVLVESYISGQEITVSIIEKDGEALALPVLELCPKNRFYDYEAKYIKGLTDFIIPARLDSFVSDAVQSYAITLHRLLGCQGFSRVDMIVDSSGQPWILELNSVPGMTETSDLPASAAVHGWSFDDVVEIILAGVKDNSR